MCVHTDHVVYYENEEIKRERDKTQTNSFKSCVALVNTMLSS